VEPELNINYKTYLLDQVKVLGFDPHQRSLCGSWSSAHRLSQDSSVSRSTSICRTCVTTSLRHRSGTVRSHDCFTPTSSSYVAKIAWMARMSMIWKTIIRGATRLLAPANLKQSSTSSTSLVLYNSPDPSAKNGWRAVVRKPSRSDYPNRLRLLRGNMR